MAPSCVGATAAGPARSGIAADTKPAATRQSPNEAADLLGYKC